MKKKILFGSVVTVFLLVIAGFTPVVLSKENSKAIVLDMPNPWDEIDDPTY